MARGKKYSPEEIIPKLREAEVLMSQGKTRQHGNKRRTWRKLHLAVDPDSQAIVAQLLTGNDTHDGDVVEPLVK